MQLLPIIRQIREDHPRMSCRVIYHMVTPRYMGRDLFEVFCYSHGFKVGTIKNHYRTTDSVGVIRFPNLMMDRDELTTVNQIWVSDITYYQVGKDVYYITFILDLYNRKIVGYCVSKTLRTEDTTLQALQMAIKREHIAHNSNLIIHSDGGGQYYSKQFTALTNYYGMHNSMGTSVFENPHAERINGTIKNDYLIPWGPKNFEELDKMLTKAVYLYNTIKPHKSLNGLSPEQFTDCIINGLLTKTWLINKKKKVTKKEKVNISII